MKIRLPNTTFGLSAIAVAAGLKFVWWLIVWYVVWHFVIKYW